MKKIEFTDSYSGRSLVLHFTEKQFQILQDEDWTRAITDYQRKRLENYFGKMNAYYTKIEIL